MLDEANDVRARQGSSISVLPMPIALASAKSFLIRFCDRNEIGADNPDGLPSNHQCRKLIHAC